MSARKVITRTVFDFKTDRWVEEESFQYDGPWALAGQPGDFDQTAYAFYEDGTEAGSVIIGSQDTQQDIDVDTTFLIRVRIQEQNQADDVSEQVGFQYNLAGAGYLDVSTTSSVLKAVPGGFTSDADTTERLTGGVGSFIATNSWTTKIGSLPNLTYAQNEYCEALISVQIVGADVSNGQELLVAMSATPNITITLAADINIVKVGGGRRRSNVT
jgi:hypothetical protein